MTPLELLRRLPRRRAVLAGAVALLVAIVAWSAYTGHLGPATGDGAASEPPDVDKANWSATGSLASDEDFIAGAAAELDAEEKSVLLWAGEARRDKDEDLTEFAVFAQPVRTTTAGEELFTTHTVGHGDDGWETVTGGGHQTTGSFANTIVVLPFDEIEGHDPSDSLQDILLTRGDVTVVRALPGDATSIEDRTVTTSDEDFEDSTRGIYAVSTQEGTGYTSPALDAPLPAEDWDSTVAERVLRDAAGGRGHDLAAVGRPASVTVGDGRATVAALADLRVSAVRDGKDDAMTWGAVVDLPEEAVDSGSSTVTVFSPVTARNGAAALSAGAPYAVPVRDERLGGSALVVTQGVKVRSASAMAADENYGDFTLERYRATTEPELPALGAATSRGRAQILEFDESSTVVIWSDDDGDPVRSEVLRPASDS